MLLPPYINPLYRSHDHSQTMGASSQPALRALHQPGSYIARPPQRTKPNPVTAKPALRLPLQETRPARHDSRVPEPSPSTRPSSSWQPRKRLLQVDMLSGESSTEAQQPDINFSLPGTYVTALSGTGNVYATAATQVDVGSHDYAKLDGSHTQYQSATNEREAEARHTLGRAEQTYVAADSRSEQENHEYDAADTHASYDTATCTGKALKTRYYSLTRPQGAASFYDRAMAEEKSPYAVIESDGNTYAVPFAFPTDGDTRNYEIPLSRPKHASVAPGQETALACGANKYMEPAAGSRPANAHHRPLGSTDHVAVEKKSSEPQACHRPLYLLLVSVLIAGAIAGAILGFAFSKGDSDSEETSNEAQVGVGALEPTIPCSPTVGSNLTEQGSVSSQVLVSSNEPG